LIALDVASGAVRWRGDLLASPVAMAVTATSVYVVGWGRLEAFDLDGCATRFCSPVWISSPWEVPTQAPGLIAVAGGVVYAQTDAFHVGPTPPMAVASFSARQSPTSTRRRWVGYSCPEVG
jgi:hypothetical protein